MYCFLLQCNMVQIWKTVSTSLLNTWVYIYARLHVGIVFAKLGLMHTLPHLTWVQVVFDNLRWQTMGMLLSIRWGFLRTKDCLGSCHALYTHITMSATHYPVILTQISAPAHIHTSTSQSLAYKASERRHKLHLHR